MPGAPQVSPAGQGRWLSCSVLYWYGLILSPVCSLGYHNIKRYKGIRKYLKESYEYGKVLVGKPCESNWGHWAFSGWRRDWGKTSFQSSASSWGKPRGRHQSFFLLWPVTEPEGMAGSCIMGSLGWMLGKGSSSREWLGTGTGRWGHFAPPKSPTDLWGITSLHRKESWWFFKCIISTPIPLPLVFVFFPTDLINMHTNLRDSFWSCSIFATGSTPQSSSTSCSMWLHSPAASCPNPCVTPE